MNFSELPLDTQWIILFFGGLVFGMALVGAFTSQQIAKLKHQNILLDTKQALALQERESLRKYSENMRLQLEELQEQFLSLTEERGKLKSELIKQQEFGELQMANLEQAKSQLIDSFKALSADALNQNNQNFLSLAKERLNRQHTDSQNDLQARQLAIDNLVKPMQTSLQQVHEKIELLDKVRIESQSALATQISGLLDSQKELRQETEKLTRALSSPQVRGRWGELQLKRVVELAGMQAHCDFHEQQTLPSEGQANSLRPDMTVHLPGNKNIVVDAKAPLDAYMKAHETEDENSKRALFNEHARHIRTHIQQLAKKSYWSQFDETPDFVVMFLPGETFFSTALQHDPALIEFGAEHRVIVATPTTLIALLRAVGYGWRQQTLEENAKKISDLGQILYKRLTTLTDHWSKLGISLDRSVKHYNDAVSSLDARVLVTARKFVELDAASEEIKTPEMLENVAKRPAEKISAEKV